MNTNIENEVSKIVFKRKYMSIVELSEVLNVSQSTIRRVLNRLQSKKLVERSHGGVRAVLTDNVAPNFVLRKHTNATQKKMIALKALKLIKEGDVIFLDGSTSTYFMAEYLNEFDNATVITNGIDTLVALAGCGLYEFQTAVGEYLKGFGFSASDCGSDAENIISLGLKGENGIILIIGTGIVAISCINGKRKKYGGLGYLFDRGGSGFDLGRDAVCEYFAQKDRGENSVLSETVKSMIPCEERDFLSELYKCGKRFIASFSVAVTRAADLGDEKAKRIIIDNAAKAAGLLDRAGKDFCGKVKTVIAGGLVSSEVYKNAFVNAVTDKEKLIIEFETARPVEGAVRLAKILI